MNKTIIIVLLFTSFLFCGNKKNNVNLKTSWEASSTHLNINNVSTIIYNDGHSDGDGYSFPRGSDNYLFYETGFIWGAYLDGDISPRVGGSVYRSGLQPGRIISKGVAEDPASARIYRVRRDVFPGSSSPDLFAELNDNEGTYDEIYNKYINDWNDWPAVYGAPFEDKNNNGVYEPNIDIPGVEGADQTIWYTANDLDPELTTYMYGSQPLGLELQVTIWGYSNNLLSGIYFRKYKIINKSAHNYNDMYVALWSDPDVGDPVDDLSGCDTILNAGFQYNFFSVDPDYSPNSPAAGFALLNVPMNAFFYFGGSDMLFTDPPQGIQSGAESFYRFMQGKYGSTGNYFVNPVTGNTTKYALSGNPLTGEGWLDQVAGDKRIGLSAGPFTMEPDSSNEFIIAEICVLDENRLNAINLFKESVVKMQTLYDSRFNIDTIAPVPASVKLDAVYNDKIELAWGNEEESYNKNGYKFQGYNVYQLKESVTPLEEANKIATFDIADGVTTIISDGDTLQTGSDTGIERNFTVTKDLLDNSKLIKGKVYYYAVTAYTHNPDATEIKSTESWMKVTAVTYLDSIPGPDFGNDIPVVHSYGLGEGSVTVTVADPDSLTGHIYKVYFTEKTENSETRHYWNLRDVSLGEDVLVDQSIIKGLDIYSPENERPGDPVADGMVISVDAIYNYPDAPTYQSEANIITNTFSSQIYTVLSDFRIYGQPTSTAKDFFGSGSTDIDRMTEDYELRYTGVLSDTVINGKNIRYVSSGGQMASIYGAASETILANHPMNPSPGSTEPFLVRLPFEMWNRKTGRQVNMVFRDREQQLTADPWLAWNSENRNYIVIVNNDYDPNNVIKTNSEVFDQYATWIIVIYSTRLQVGDVISINLRDPVKTGIDEFTFDSPSLVSVTNDEAVPSSYSLFQNYPNPFNPETNIQFSLKQQGHVELSVYNILGEEVAKLVNGELTAGTHNIKFNGANFASGVYFYKIKVNDFAAVKKLMLVK